MAKPSHAQGLHLTLYLGTTLLMLGEPYAMPTIEPELAMRSKEIALSAVLDLQLLGLF